MDAKQDRRMTMTAPKRVVIRPQPGPQEVFLASDVDVAIMGGAAGVGKTYALLLAPLQSYRIAEFSAVIFRRTSPEITNPGGLWDESARLYPHVQAQAKQNPLEWIFPSGARVRFSHMQYETDRFAWDGAQIPFVGFDQVESFSELQFWYLFSRNRDPSGRVRPYIRATCNPVPADDPVGGWLHELIAWWLDEETGAPRWDRSGRARWFVREGEDLVWADDAASLKRAYPESEPKSLTFIPGRLDDNPALLKADPGYRANLLALPLVERARLLGGNWNARPAAGKVFNRAWFVIVGTAPRAARRVRYWDKAGTEGGGDYSAGVKVAAHDGRYWIEDVVRGQWSSRDRNAVIRQTATLDGGEVAIWLEQEGGSGGKESAELSVRELAGFNVRTEAVTGDKLTRAQPLSAQAEAGNVQVVAGAWNTAYLSELHSFDGSGRGHDDQVDASSGAFNKLALEPGPMTIGLLGQEAGARRVVVAG